MSSRVSSSENTIQQQILATVARLHRERDSWPSQQAVRDALQLPRSTARYQIRALEAAKKLERLEGGRILRIPKEARA